LIVKAVKWSKQLDWKNKQKQKAKMQKRKQKGPGEKPEIGYRIF
jgi:hypothetical protein